MQLQQFLDDWHYRIMHTSLGRTWNRKKVISAALEIMVLHGMPLTPEEISDLVNMEETAMIEQLVWRMPQSLRESFEHLALELQMLVTMVTRMRKTLEDGSDSEVSTLMDECNGTGVCHDVLKQAVVQASKEVETMQKCQKTWVKNMEKRLGRLQQASEMAEHCQQQLLAVEGQLEQMGGGTKEKGKKVLMGLAEGNIKTLLHSVFSSWNGITLKEKAEWAIRKKYDDELKHAEATLVHLKERQLGNIKGVLMRNARESDAGLLTQVVTGWKNSVLESKRDGDTKAAMKEMEDKLSNFATEQAANTKKVMARMGAAKDGNLLMLAFQAFAKYCADYKKDKEFEDQVKRAEQSWQEHMKKKKDEATRVLDRMGGGMDTTLLQSMIQHWCLYISDEKKAREMDDALNGGSSKFKSLCDRQSGNAKGVQNRVNEQMKQCLIFKCLCAWALESKVNRVDQYFVRKMDGKRRQLQGVQSLFKSFAAQLEDGLQVDGDSSGRRALSRRTGGSMSKGEGSVSLPDIHAKQGVPA